MKRGSLSLLLGLLIITASVVATDIRTALFDVNRVRQNVERMAFEYDSLPQAPTPFSISLPVKTVYAELSSAESTDQITSLVASSAAVFPHFPISNTGDKATSEEGRYDFATVSSTSQLGIGNSAVIVEGEVRVGDRRFAKLILLPVSMKTADSIVCNEEIVVSVGPRAVEPGELLSQGDLQDIQRVTAERSGMRLSASSEAAYVVITCDSLASACLSFVRHKISMGFSTFIKTIEEITASYSGVDDAEKLRNYLKDFYAQGGTYVLLAGDETILPIRHSYHIDVPSPLSIDQQLLCDLYFADLTGNWDVDGDGAYGERNSDQADLIPELRLGRLPVSTAHEIDSYTRKVIAYETNPGRGDFSYLNRAFFFSSDEMRDYSGGGQHALIAKAYPSSFEIDTVDGVEASYGADPAPSNVAGAAINDTLSQGYGIVNIIAHGRYDGFAVRTSTYNAWPKSLLLSDYLGGSHTDISALAPNGHISFYYSLSCDVGGFDEDLAPLNHTGTNFVQRMLTLDSAGAVAFVGYSRWGWVASSYLLQKAFFNSLFANPGRPAIEAMYDSKAVYAYLRDLVYGQNFYGDPSLVVYTSQPKKLSLSYEQNIEGLVVTGEIDGAPAQGSIVRLVTDTTLLGTYSLGDDGVVTIDYPFELGTNYTITAQKEGSVTAAREYRPGLGAGTGDDNLTILPGRFSLSQNYPNPFNPTTSIAFDLPHRTQVSLNVFNLLGEVVSSLVNDEMPAGRHEVIWDGTTDGGSRTASGVYFYRLSAEDFSETRKMILLK